MTELYPQPYQSDSLPQHHQENSFSMNKSQSRPSMSLILEDNDKLNSSLNYSNLISQKEQMQRLNRRLETYIEESHSIDKDIEKLMKENELLKSQLKPDKDYKVENFQDQYQDKFEALRREIRELSSECNRLEHDRQNTRTETELVNQKTKSLEIEREILNKSIKEAYEETQLVNDEHKKLALEIEVLKHEISEEEKRYETEQALLNSRLNANRNNLVEEAAMPNQFKTLRSWTRNFESASRRASSQKSFRSRLTLSCVIQSHRQPDQRSQTRNRSRD